MGYIPKKAWFVLGFGLLISFLIPLIISNEEFLLGRFLDYVFNVSIIVYLFKILTIHQKNVINYYSEIEQKTLSWIQTILYIMLGFYILWIAEDVISLFNQELPEVFALTSTIATCALIYWIGYKGLSQPEIFNQSLYKEHKVESNSILEIKSNTKIEIEDKKNTTNKEDLNLFNELKEQIIDQKLYTNQQLNLRGLAIELNIKEKELSRVINTQTNFYQLINTLRVNEFKTLIQSPKANQLSLLGLANEAGFSSKSTFYAAFKKLEGMTPKQYESKLKSN